MKKKLIVALLLGLLILSACMVQAPAPAPTAAPAEESATEAAGERVTSAIELTTNPWLWTSFTDPVEQFDIETPENYTVTFNTDGTVNIKADCNNASGSYTADDNGSLAIEIGPMTMAACPPDSRSDEFVQKLGFVANFFFENGFLYLDMMADGGTFQLASASEHMPAGEMLGIDALKNATYSGIYDEGPVMLTDGLYEGEPFVAGGAARPRIEYIDGGERFGDLDGDGVADAAVVLVESAGGSGVFTYIAAQLNQDGQAVDAGAVWVGDRTQIAAMAVADGQIVLDIVTQGPDDAQCCPTLKIRKLYALQDDQLTEVGSEELGAVAVDDLNGTSWVLVALGGEALSAEDEEPITISFQDGEISGFGGCNRYNSSFAAEGENPLAVAVGPIAGTRMACPEPRLTQETTYFSALEHVSQWGYRVGQLSLFYVNDDGTTGTLLFTAQMMVTESASTTQEPSTAATASERITLAIELTTNPWLWTSFTDPVEQFDVETPENYTIAFNTDGTINIKADCNNAGGSYTADDTGSLTIEIGPMTRAMCPPGSR
ncbi:MAG: META domain-containing protein, partial [Caldilineaceae bacterium]|nr:META domain-containing protein [Caldilineaceae bacterium]